MADDRAATHDALPPARPTTQQAGRRGGRRPRAVSLPPEVELAHLWAAQFFPDGALSTADGLPVRVDYPGRPGAGAGPDFRDAVLHLGDGPARVGDVELHREAADFARHGHTGDPAYGRVLLHVVFAADRAEPTPLPSGRQAPLLVAPAPPDGRRAPLREPCAAAPGRMGAEHVRAVLREAGLWRLRQKADALQAAIEADGPAQALYGALAVTLGQTANRGGFAELARRAPLASLAAAIDDCAEPDAPRAVERRLLHAAGLDGALLSPGPAIPWVVRGLRPAATPARRVAALAGLVARLWRPLPAAGARDAPGDAEQPGRMGAPVSPFVAGARALVDRARGEGARTLIAALAVPARDGPALCGRGRAVELAVNALLPWAAACATLAGDDEAAGAILALAGGLPAAESYGAVAHLHRNLRDARGRALIGSALQQQGALAMLGEWCRRGGCGRCPLS